MRRVVALGEHAAPDVEDKAVVLAALDGGDEQHEAFRKTICRNLGGISPSAGIRRRKSRSA
jgi:hypothetical protein